MSLFDMKLTETYDQYINRVNERVSDFNKNLNLYDINLDKLINKRILTQEQVNIIRTFSDTVEEVYPGKWCLQFEVGIKFKNHRNTDVGYGNNNSRELWPMPDKLILEQFSFVIHFPQTVVTNTSNMSITVKDLFVKHPIRFRENELPDEDDIFSEADLALHLYHNDLQGIVTTISNRQAITGYLHSHLRQISYAMMVSRRNDSDAKYQFTRFCTGQGDIGSVKSLLNINPLDKVMFIFYLESIKNFIIWESVEGRPYIEMSTVLGTNYNIESEVFCTYTMINAAARIVDKARRGMIIMNLDYKFEEETNRYTIVDNDKLESLLTCLFHSLSLNVYHKDNRGNYFRSTRLSENSSYVERIEELKLWIPFKGQKVFLKVDPTLDVKQDNSLLIKKYIHPALKKGVKHELEQHINQKAIEGYILTKLNTTSY